MKDELSMSLFFLNFELNNDLMIWLYDLDISFSHNCCKDFYTEYIIICNNPVELCLQTQLNKEMIGPKRRTIIFDQRHLLTLMCFMRYNLKVLPEGCTPIRTTPHIATRPNFKQK